MRYPIFDSLAIVLLIASSLSVAYSLAVLLRVGKGGGFRYATAPTGKHLETMTSSIAITRVDPNDFLLSLIATYDPRVKALLSSLPDEVTVGLRHVGPPDDASTGLVSVPRGEESQEVWIDLNQYQGLRPLFEALLMRAEQAASEEARVA